VNGAFAVFGAYFLCHLLVELNTCVGQESIKMTIKDKFPLKLNLQHFGGEGDEGEGDNAGDSAKGDQDPTVPKLLTEEEINKKIEAESDRKLNSALEKKKQEFEQEKQEAIKNAIEEKERLSKLSQKEREDEALTQREKDLQKREADITRKLLRSETVDDLQEKNLPSDFADFLLGDDAESTLENVNTFKKSFDEAVNNAVKEKLRQETPPANTGSTSSKAPTIAGLAKENRII